MLDTEEFQIIYAPEQPVDVCVTIRCAVIVDRLERLYHHAVQPGTLGDLDIHLVVSVKIVAGSIVVVVSHVITSLSILLR